MVGLGTPANLASVRLGKGNSIYIFLLLPNAPRMLLMTNPLIAQEISQKRGRVFNNDDEKPDRIQDGNWEKIRETRIES